MEQKIKELAKRVSEKLPNTNIRIQFHGHGADFIITDEIKRKRQIYYITYDRSTKNLTYTSVFMF